MSKAPEGYAALPFIGGNPEEEAPEFGMVAKQETMKLTLYVDRARRLQEATGLVPYTLNQAANVFGLIYRIASSGLELQENEALQPGRTASAGWTRWKQGKARRFRT